MVMSWLLNSLSKDIGDSVSTPKLQRSFRTVWSNDLASLVQGNTDIAGYFTKLKRLWDELDSLNLLTYCSCVCTCQEKGKLTKSLADQRLIQFLNAQARGNILMMNPLPTIDNVYPLVLQDEHQNEAYINPFIAPSADSFMVTQQGKGIYRSGTSLNRVKFGKPFQKFKPKKTKYNPNVSCTYCGKTGHVLDDCHRLIGYPDDFRFTKNNNYSTSVKGNVVVTGEENTSIPTVPIGDSGSKSYDTFLSKEQYSNLVHQVIQDMQHIEPIFGINVGANALLRTITKY
ncbi:hypothetical protein H5410_038239 [Solanum commersonii]|uniref:CCHC-type domain-containing protein n=1 Tax=Solanum commersonii TaxID=4109 RepID=A0A9J5YAR8_SOLCO|nr:hypothetical protein H5410_038239 [Solanum commersonii]